MLPDNNKEAPLPTVASGACQSNSDYSITGSPAAQRARVLSCRAADITSGRIICTSSGVRSPSAPVATEGDGTPSRGSLEAHRTFEQRYVCCRCNVQSAVLSPFGTCTRRDGFQTRRFCSPQKPPLCMTHDVMSLLHPVRVQGRTELASVGGR